MGRNVISVALSVAWVSEVLSYSVSEYLLVFPHKTVPKVYTGLEGNPIKHPVSQSSVGGNVLLMK